MGIKLKDNQLIVLFIDVDYLSKAEACIIITHCYLSGYNNGSFLKSYSFKKTIRLFKEKVYD